MAFEQQAQRFFQTKSNELQLHIQIAAIDKLFSARSRFQSFATDSNKISNKSLSIGALCMQNKFSSQHTSPFDLSNRIEIISFSTFVCACFISK